MRTYTTVNGDTWEGIAYKVYGDSYRMSELLAANPLYTGTFIFPAGIVLKVPIDAANRTPSILPWKGGIFG